jgi:hypothetical protein
MTDKSKIILEMNETMEGVLEVIEEHFHNDPAFRLVRKIATEMKTELEEVQDLYEG